MADQVKVHGFKKHTVFKSIGITIIICSRLIPAFIVRFGKAAPTPLNLVLLMSLISYAQLTIIVENKMGKTT